MRHIRDCLSKQFTKLYQQAQDTQHLTDIIRQYLPDILREHCYVLHMQRGCLTLGTPDATWATQLRYLLPQLRDQLRQEQQWHHLVSINIVIQVKQPTRTPSQSHATKRQTISPWQSILQALEKKKHQV